MVKIDRRSWFEQRWKTFFWRVFQYGVTDGTQMIDWIFIYKVNDKNYFDFLYISKYFILIYI